MKFASIAMTFWLGLPVILAAQSKDKGKGKELELPVKRVGIPGELTPEEEDRLDQLLDRFIQHDIGVRPDPKSREELDRLGPEAIPALIRALNRTAQMRHSCPVTIIAAKLKKLLERTDELEVLRSARENIGAGVTNVPHAGILRSLRFSAMMRERQLHERAEAAQRSGTPTRSPGGRPPL